MAIHNALGKAGEDAVAAYLEHNGYVIRDRNWRKNRLELDIVATKDNGLIIVEVKTLPPESNEYRNRPRILPQ